MSFTVCQSQPSLTPPRSLRARKRPTWSVAHRAARGHRHTRASNVGLPPRSSCSSSRRCPAQYHRRLCQTEPGRTSIIWKVNELDDGSVLHPGHATTTRTARFDRPLSPRGSSASPPGPSSQPRNRTFYISNHIHSQRTHVGSVTTGVLHLRSLNNLRHWITPATWLADPLLIRRPRSNPKCRQSSTICRFRRDPRATRGLRVGPLATDQLSMPTKQGVGLNKESMEFQPGDEPAEAGESARSDGLRTGRATCRRRTATS